MQVRRCSVLFLEPREEVEFDLGSLLEGGAGLSRTLRWLAIAPHLESSVEIDSGDRELLGRLSPSVWSETDCFTEAESKRIERLLHDGLLIGEGESSATHRQRDELLRDGNWWTVSAIFHREGRWKGVDGVTTMQANDLVTAKGLRKHFGPPPLHVAERAACAQRIGLPRESANDFSALLARRATCRNFDMRPLSQSMFAQILERVFAAQAQVRVDDDTVFLKKTSPSGGGLHATGAYLIVQNVEDVEPGLYHYHPVDHALEPLPPPALPLGEFARLALAGQHWFANAPVLVALTPRFARSFWKYRHHAKAYRALILDSGHLSQTLYLSATELGLGAFVTSAINEVDIEQAFGLDPLQESPLAICGFGWRAERMETAEFDPACQIWEQVLHT